MKNKKQPEKAKVLAPQGLWAILNAAKLKEMEEKDLKSEQVRAKDFSLYISPDYDYSPTVDDFKEELVIQKLNKRANEYLLFLRETKKVYSNAKYYYIKWGERGSGIDKSELYANILGLINSEIQSELNALSSSANGSLNMSTPKGHSANTLRKYKIYVSTYNDFIKNEKFSSNESEKMTCEKYGISPKTLLRAIRAI